MSIPFSKLVLGQIVWANLPDMGGNQTVDHRFIIIVPPKVDLPEATMGVVGISTNPPRAGDEHTVFDLKHNPKDGGHRTTRLTKPCRAHCLWSHDDLRIDEVINLGGSLCDFERLAVLKIYWTLRGLLP